MTYQPVLPFAGAAGWSFLQNTKERQQAVFNQSAEMQRDTAYFVENIGNVQTAEDLVSDYRLLKVALGAYGLDDDIGNKYFVQKVLEDGTLDVMQLAVSIYFAAICPCLLDQISLPGVFKRTLA